MKFIPVIGDPFHLSSQNRFLSRFRGNNDRVVRKKSKLVFCTGVYTSRSPVKPPGYDNEDSYCVDGSYLCVADGVGGWISQGISSALYSKELVRNVDCALKSIRSRKSKVSKEEFLELLNYSYERTKSSRLIGSSTLSVAVLDSLNRLHIYNLGDSKCLIYRMSERKIIYESDTQQHEFNIPYQLGTGSFDKPKDGQYCIFDNVKVGDTVILATDGLWDNLSIEHIIDIFESCLGLEPQIVSEKLGQKALKSSLSLNHVSPYAICVNEFLINRNALSCDKNNIFTGAGKSNCVNDLSGCEVDVRELTSNGNFSDEDHAVQEDSLIERSNNGSIDSSDGLHRSNYVGGKPDDITIIIGIISVDTSYAQQ